MKREISGYISIILCAGGLLLQSAMAEDTDQRWSAEKAWDWYRKQPWIVGCNFLPSTAVNDVEMWQAETFDQETIDRELGMAESLGFNSVRVFLNYVVWQADPEGLKKRFEQFLKIADRHGIRAMPIFFDDCAFAGREPVVGKQADPVNGVHNSGWVASPGKSRVMDRNVWPDLEKYVKDIVGAFRKDKRIIIWDLYNEPANDGMGENSRPLLEAVFKWTREMKPVQPLTVGAWANFNDPLQRRMMELSDIVSFHGYDNPGGIEAKIKVCSEYGRPVICTEWLLRQGNNKFETLMPMFRERKIGCYNWGLVAGRTQTYFPWGSKQGASEPAIWQHDIFRLDGTPYDADEVALIRQLTGSVKVSSGKSADSAAIDQKTLDKWSAPYRGWHYYPDPVIPSDWKISGHENFHSYDVPTVYQIPGDKKKWYMSFIGFNGQGYNSFVCESTNLINWTNPRLAMGFGKEGEFDFGGCVVGAYLYESYDINAPRMLKKRDGKYWTLYGCYAKQGGYEIDPGYEGVATSEDGLTWTRARAEPILSVHDKDCKEWEMHCIYQPWLVEYKKKFYNFYNAKRMPEWIEQMGGATSADLLNWQRYTNNPVVSVRKGGYDEKFCSDGKVFRDGDHWVMFYFGVGRGGAHIMAAFSRDLVNWTAHPEPLYKAGGHPGGLDKQYAHKISLVYNKANDTFYMYYCAVGNKGRCVGLITSKPIKSSITEVKPQAVLTIDTGVPAKPYSPMIFGGFLEHFDRQIYGGVFEPGSPLSDKKGFRKDVIKALKELNVPIVRWPGGCFVSGYHWEGGVGRDRKPADDMAWGVIEPNTFGTDEYVELCKAMDWIPYICNNAGNGTVEEMRNWVEYCNAEEGKYAQKRKESGYAKPRDVKIWSIGNENWGGHEIGNKPIGEWASLVLEAAKQMKAADPNIQLTAAALPSKEWTLPLLKAAGEYLDYISIHNYWLPLWGDNQMPDYLTCIMHSDSPEQMISKYLNVLDESGYRGRVKIAFDEWNLRGWHHPGFPRKTVQNYNDPEVARLVEARKKSDIASQYTMADALFSASFFNACLRHSEDVGMANIAPIVNTRGPLFVHPKGIVKRTHYHTMAMYANELESMVAKTEVKSDPLKHGNSSVAMVDAVATVDKSGKHWAIALVNRNPAGDVDCTVKLKDFLPDGKFKAIVLAGDSPDAFNDIEHPDRVVPENTKVTFKNGVVTLPPHSLMIVRGEGE